MATDNAPETDHRNDPQAAIETAWLKLMTESVSFLSERLEEDLETQEALLACKSPADLMRVQTEFYQKAMTQYSAEASRLMGLFTGGLTNTKRDYDDIPL